MSYPTRLVGYVYKTDRYVLAFGEYTMKVFKGGDIPSIVMDGAAAYELVTPWSSSEVFDLVFAPRGQAIFHPDHDIYELVCDADADWTLTPFSSAYGPFLDQNADESLTITPSGTTGDITLAASADLFEADHVGALWKLTHPVDEVTLQGTFKGGVDPATFVDTATSSTVTLKGDYDINIQWRGWGTLTLDRSADGGSTWQVLKQWINPEDEKTTIVSMPDGGTELEDDIQFRFSMNWGTILDQTAMYNDWESQVKWAWRLRRPFCTYSMTAQAVSQTGIVRITAVTDAKNADATVLNTLGATTATAEWFEGAWSPYRGYPAKGTIHEGRIYAARTDYQPTTVWAGRPFYRRSDPRVFYAGTDVTDDDAFTRTIDSPDCHTIEWLSSLWVLLMGSDGNLTKCIGAGENTPMTPTQFNAMPQSGMGSNGLQPLMIGGHALYCGRNGKRVYEMTYSDDSRVYNPEDLTRYAEHVTGDGIVDWAFQQQPYPILWAVTDGGQLIGLSRDKQTELLAWHRHITDGTFESVAVIPSDGDDEVWVVVQRDVNGTAKRYVERMRPFGPYSGGDCQRDCWFVDSSVKWDGGDAVTITSSLVDGGTNRVTVTAAAHGFTDGWTVRIAGVVGMTDLNGHVYTVADKTTDEFVLKTRDGTAYIDGSTFSLYTSDGTVERVTNELTGLTHLAAEEVRALLDGQPNRDTLTVTALGVLDLGDGDRDYYNTIIVGRPYTHTLEPMWPEVRTLTGTAQGKTKKLTNVTLRLYLSAGGQQGGYIDGELETVEIDYRKPGHEIGADVELVTDDVPGESPTGWTKDGGIVLTGSDPLPFTVTAILFGME